MSPDPYHPTPVVRAGIFLASALFVFAGCGGSSELGGRDGGSAPVLEEVEVGGPPDSTLSTRTDRKAPALRPPAVAGALPGDFPEGLPLYQPSSVVDFGEREGRRYVEFRVSDPPEVVRVGLLAEWEQAGWRPAGGASYRRGDARIDLEVVEFRGSTRIRILY